MEKVVERGNDYSAFHYMNIENKLLKFMVLHILFNYN